ncbi:MAG: glycosyltransferase family 2 protein [Desulfobacterium sp.]|nr:glycosyltransferase family 2 protein [Desulfobacterium sp.]
MYKYKVSIILPVFNEAEIIVGLILKIKDLYPDYEVIVINDGSTDNSAELAKKAGAIVYSHPYNIGNGAAIKSGIRVASGEILVFMDGDGQHDPADIAGLLNYIPEYDMAVGARTIRDHASFGRALGNNFYNWLASYVAKFSIKDLTSGFRAIKSNIARNFINLLPNTYSYPTTLTLSVLRSGWAVIYVPIEIKARKTGKSNIKFYKDGVRFFIIITKICTLYSPLRIFLPVSSVIFLLGLSNSLYTLIFFHRFTNMSALLLSTSIIIFMMGLVSEQICQMRHERQEENRSPISKE